jgi:tetratricopeptide (TPR) repeat protein
MGRIYLRAGALEPAAKWLNEALVLDPTFVEAYVPLAEAHARRKAPHVALGYLDGGIEIAPNEWTLRLKRAVIRRDLGMWKEALADAEAALALQPGDAAALRIRSEARAKLGIR